MNLLLAAECIILACAAGGCSSPNAEFVGPSDETSWTLATLTVHGISDPIGDGTTFFLARFRVMDDNHLRNYDSIQLMEGFETTVFVGYYVGQDRLTLFRYQGLGITPSVEEDGTRFSIILTRQGDQGALASIKVETIRDTKVTSSIEFKPRLQFGE